MKKPALAAIFALVLFGGFGIAFYSMVNFNFAFPMLMPIIFFIVIAVFLVVFIKGAMQRSGAGPRIQGKSPINSNLNKCEKCHQEIDPVYEFCPYCGASQKNTTICQYCEHVNPKTNALCEKCNGFLD